MLSLVFVNKPISAARRTFVSHTQSEKHVWEAMPKELVADGIHRRFVSGRRITVTHFYFEKGARVPEHAHANEQVSYVLSGALRFWIGADAEETVDIGAGEVLVIPPNVTHKAEALADTLELDVFSPPRKDWLAGTDTYFRDT